MTRRPISVEQFARSRISAVLALGQSKTALGSLVHNVITSVGTARNFEQCLRDFLRWRTAQNVSIDWPVTRAEMEAYLLHESSRWRQKTLDQHRQALRLVFSVALTHFDAEVPTVTEGRAYTFDEMERIAGRQAPHNALATRIAFHAGVRAAELYELREAHELAPEPDRPWRNDLFIGMPDGIIYRVVGKGGLARSVLIPLELHVQLQFLRLDTPTLVIDRLVHRKVRFLVGGGQAISESFSSTSNRVLGFSYGFHGLRHRYAQARLETLLSMRLDPLDCLEILSQEMGHLRPDISLAYTTRRKSDGTEN